MIEEVGFDIYKVFICEVVEEGCCMLIGKVK